MSTASNGNSTTMTKNKSVVSGQKIVLKKGFDIKLVGAPNDTTIKTVDINRVAIRPIDFLGMSPIPKVVVAVGDEVKAGDPLFFDKKRPDINYVSPVSGEIVDIVRGAKRAITEVVVLADKQQSYRSFDVPKLSNRDSVKSFMATSGLWNYINQRPFDTVADLDVVPRDVFISTFDSAPLAIDYSVIIEGKEDAFQKGIDVLKSLTDGNVYLGLDGRAGSKIASGYSTATNVIKNHFKGKHPAGNVGIQIHHTAPINSGDHIWTLDVQSVITIGKMFLEGKYDSSRIVAVVGGMLKDPKYVYVHQGASVGDILADNIDVNANNRIIAGNVLTGKQTTVERFMGYKDNQITVIEEGNKYEMFGWLLPLKPRPSISWTFPNFLFPNKKFKGETNTHGEKRAFVVTGQYESVLPMDIYPQHLMKAIMAGDFELMEGLGINELTEEDIAICEFVCTSKMPLQSILRDGLEMMKSQG